MKEKLTSKNKLVLFLGFLFILLWQGLFLPYRLQLNADYQISEVVGLHGITYPRFLYFLYYFNEFPVASSLDLPYSQEGAIQFVRDHGASLRSDIGEGTSKIGNYGKIFLYYPEVLLNGTPKGATPKLGNILLFVTALVSLFFSFAWIGSAGLGLFFVILFGSNPFQLFNTYRISNVFSTAITAHIFILALSLPFIKKIAFGKKHIFLAALSGFLLALAKEVRTEAHLVILALPFLYLITTHFKWTQRLVCVFALILSFSLVSKGIRRYFDLKFESAKQFILKAGGLPYEGPRQDHHVVWHIVATGLGDFGQKYGYKWDDQTVYRYSAPRIKEKYGLNVHWTEGNYFFDEFWDKEKQYQIQPEDLWQHEEVIKEKVLGDIKKDPLWFAGVLLKRVWRLLDGTTPIRFALGKEFFDFRFPGWAALFVIGFLIWQRNTFALKIVLLVLPLSILPIAHHAERGSTYYGLFHVVAFAFLTEYLYRWVRSFRLSQKQNKVSDLPVT